MWKFTSKVGKKVKKDVKGRFMFKIGIDDSCLRDWNAKFRILRLECDCYFGQLEYSIEHEEGGIRK